MALCGNVPGRLYRDIPAFYMDADIHMCIYVYTQDCEKLTIEADAAMTASATHMCIETVPVRPYLFDLAGFLLPPPPPNFHSSM
jgi:hypothetical protein